MRATPTAPFISSTGASSKKRSAASSAQRKRLRSHKEKRPAMITFWQDIRYGWRMLWKSPSFTVIAVLALALGIGANTAIFSVVNAVLLRPLPFTQSDRLMNVWETNQKRGITQSSVAYPNFADWRTQNHVFERMASYHTNDFTLTGSSEPLRLQGAVVNAELFPLLDAQPQLGRPFRPEEEKPGDSGRVVVVRHALGQ